MIRAEHNLPDRQRALVERPGRREVALLPSEVALSHKQTCEFAEAKQGVGMFWALPLLADCQRALQKRSGRSEVVLVPTKQACKAGEALCRVRMLIAEHLLANGQRALNEWPCLRRASGQAECGHNRRRCRWSGCFIPEGRQRAPNHLSTVPAM
jgi:hypothetical protein